MKIKLHIVLLILLAAFLSVSAQSSVSFNGQVVGWTTASIEDPLLFQPGLRFVPTLTGKYEMQNKSEFDFEASLNINGSLTFSDWRLMDTIGQIKPYRIWLRCAKDKFEVRAGLQKINFGSAKMFRPLMWFDGMDVRDPLQLTDGVYGLLAKYFFDNNANVWLWGLMGNTQPKGFEMFGSSKWKPEIGGRIEYPLGPGEIGLSYHHRTLSQQNNNLLISLPDYEYTENRFGFNGKWDLAVGLWIESSVSLMGENYLSSFYFPKKTDMLNIGMDYTIPLGSGVGVTLEYFRYHAGDQLFTGGNTAHVLGSMLTYPLTILDNLSGMIFFIPAGSNSMWLNYVTWSRTYDNVSLYAMAFWNPTNYNIPAFQSQGTNMFAGKGFQFMISYNF